MGKKRKRSIKDRGPTPSSHIGITGTRRFRSSTPNPRETSHPVISLYYRKVVSLRDYLLQQLPVTSKSRRRRILTLGSRTDTESQMSLSLAQLLDSTLVGVLQVQDSCPIFTSQRQKEYWSFNESQSRSLLASTDTGPSCPQSEVCCLVFIEMEFADSTPGG